MEILYAVIGSVLILLGLAGIFVPILPGLPLAWLGFFIYAIGTGFERISVLTVVIFFIVMLLILSLDLLAPAMGAKKYRASKFGILGAIIGSIIGLVVFGPLGIVLGPIIGAFVFELLAKGKPDIAFKTALGTFVGCIVGGIVKLVYLLILTGFFIEAIF